MELSRSLTSSCVSGKLSLQESESMVQRERYRLHYGRAIGLFVAAYIAVTVLAIAL